MTKVKSKFIHIIFLCALIIYSVAGWSQNLLIKLYSDKQLSSIKVKVELGRYYLITGKGDTLNDDSKMLVRGDLLEAKAAGNKVNIAYNNKSLGNYPSVKIQSAGFKNIFCIMPSGGEKRSYDDNLLIKASNNSLYLINDVNPENYVAGVVQSEIYGKPECIDIFKIQSIISRTYALKNINKHQSEGFNLCDGVHCQAYKNRCLKPEVLTGAMESKGEIIIDSSGQLIDAAFHSNSGGQTANSEDVWIRPISYLRSRPDTFSLSMKNTNWEKEFSINEWLSYFSKKHGLDVNNEKIRDELLNFTQDERKSNICAVPLKTIRNDLRLRSTFFSVIRENENIKLIGKGYGHGVGLSQEGAIRMVELGYAYKDVLLYYYEGAKILSVNEEKQIENSNQDMAN